MASEQDIRNQLELLHQHRQNVQLLLRQIAAQGGWKDAPLAQLNALTENRRGIARCKAALRGWQAQVDDHPHDEPGEELGTLDQQIRELEQSLGFPLPEAARQPLMQILQGARERCEALGAVQFHGPLVAAPVRARRDVYIATHQTINNTFQQFFGTLPPENGVALLSAYLDALGRECEHLRLSRLTGQRQTGADLRADPPLRLQAVYTSLTTQAKPVVVHHREQSVARVIQLLRRLNHKRTPDNVCPEQVREIQVTGDLALHGLRERGFAALVDRTISMPNLPDTPCTLQITRPELALEAIKTQRRLVLLGEPGAGKSTVLRYLTLLLARQLRGGKPLPGWSNDDLPIPIICPLGRVAAALTEHKGNADKALDQVLGDLLEGEHGQCAGLRAHLKPALRGPGVLLLFDGLDELSAEATSVSISPRSAVAQAIRNLERWTDARIVVTSRVLPYHAASDWQLSTEEGWQTRTLAPLAFGQVRTFVSSWYAALAATGTDPELHAGNAQIRADALIAELEASATLRSLVASPLLLTMLAILHYNTDEVPRDRVRLYEECVQLLLARWEPVRTPGQRRPGLLERLGDLPGLELDILRSALHELAFQAHNRPPGDDGRGLIDGDALHGRMLRLFTSVRSPNAARAVTVFEQALSEDAGLLLARDDGQYAFPHLTFQEYLAACHLADQPSMSDIVKRHWHSPDDEHWHEVLRLLVGRLRQQGKVQDKLIPWLLRLVAPRQPRSVTERRRDTVLATLVYSEIGRAALLNSALDITQLIDVSLREAVLELLTVCDPAISTADRIRSGFLLGEIGDTRLPARLEEWQHELQKVRAGDTSGYFCRVEAGTYWIGSTNSDPEAREDERPRRQMIFAHPFWIGRYPLTNVQWQMWVQAGGNRSPSASNGNFNHPNQPVVGITWNDARDFCSWLRSELGVEIRLPHEAEWEAAARGPERRHYPWGRVWKDDQAATAEDQETRGWPRSVPVGCYPAGAAACGALDMAGNVWEWTADEWQSYPGAKNTFSVGNGRVLRGGSYWQEKAFARCGARCGIIHNFQSVGMRVVLAPNERTTP